MGYAVPSQRGTGIHIRLRSRAFVIADAEKSDNRVVFVSVDGGMGSDLVNMRVIEKLKQKYGNALYTDQNVAISGTHTHSGPAGFLQYVLYQITSLGYVDETLDAWVNGIFESIERAHDNLRPALISATEKELDKSNINRSPTSYQLNPEAEKAMYDADTDKNMFLLQFLATDDSGNQEPMGMVNWFAVHATSMNNTNTLVSGDNKGYASYALERVMNGRYSAPGMGPFVGAFASSNLGDVSPNTAGPKCIDTGEPCDGSTSTCNGRCEKCIAFGPGENGDMFESTQIIGDQQFQHAMDLMSQPNQEIVSGDIDYRHAYVKMKGLNVSISQGYYTELCSPAMGYSFAAGTTDGPGAFNFTQGTTSGNPFWDKVRDFLSEPSQEEIKCQAPKPILLNTGDIDKPYEWDPETVAIQILRIGNVFILSVPAELTTMAGRRLRNQVKNIVRESGIIPIDKKIHVTIAGLCNGYSSYVTTYEEYQAQRYEAASTIFGPHTLDGYIQEFSRLARDMVTNTPSYSDPPPPDLSDQLFELIPSNKFDRVPIGTNFGDVLTDVDTDNPYHTLDTVIVKFRSANPRNNQRANGSYLAVQYEVTQELGTLKRNFNSAAEFLGMKTVDKFETEWKNVALDGDWETKFHWVNVIDDPLAFGVSGISSATIEWNIPSDAEAGNYRICHYGDEMNFYSGEIKPFEGCSSIFKVVV